MQRFRTRLLAVAFATAIAAPLIGPANPASAIPAPDGCNATTVPAALIAWYPANPASQSSLKANCSLNNQPGTSQVTPSFTVHEANVIQYHNGAARAVTTSATASAGATTVQLSTASNGIVGLPVSPAQMNRVITGHAGLPTRTFVKSMSAGGLLTLSTPVGAGGIPSGTVLKIENAPGARSVTDAVLGGPTTTLSSATANFDSTTDVGLLVSGTGIAAFTTISSVTNSTTAVLSAPMTLTGATVSIGGSLLTTTARQVTGATITSAVRINSTAAGWTSTDIGLKVTGGCNQLTAVTTDDTVIPANTYITATPSGANADTTGGLPSGSSGCTLVVGESNANATGNGDVAGTQGVQLNLNPSLVAGSDDCANDQPEGFVIVMKYYNPGSFQGTGLTNAQPGPTPTAPTAAPTKAVGQLFFDTSAADFSAFIIERKSLTAGDPIGSVHYDVVTPFAPTGLAMCPGTATSPGLTFSLAVFGTTTTQSTLASGTGRPGTSQLRSVLPSTSGGYTTTAYVTSEGPAAPFTPASAFNRLCIYPVGSPNPANFQCGPG
ncbi:MAG: hypothetical protein ACT4OV_14425 [Microthrixaceae bacterium]